MKETFLIDNKLLIQAICGGSTCDKLNVCNGYLYYEYDKPIGRAFLEFCYSELFNIHRFPGYENYYESGSRECNWLVESGAITEEAIQDAVKQLKELYEFTQKTLKKKGLKNLTLYRSLQNHEYRTLCRTNEEDGLQIRTNTLMSFAYTNRTTYGTNIKIKQNINAKDILMIDDITEYDLPDATCNYRVKTGEYEMWVINKDRYGRLQFKYKDIVQDLNHLVPSIETIKNKPSTFRDPISKATDGSMSDNSEFLWRPCEYGRLAPWIVNRNADKIKHALNIKNNEE